MNRFTVLLTVTVRIVTFLPILVFAVAVPADGQRAFAGKTPVFTDEGTFIREAVARYWRRHGDIPAVPQGRITIGD